MRKTFVVALVALMVMFAVTSCDNIPVPGSEPVEYTADGRQLVTLTVNVGGTVNGRSLTDPLAKTGADFVEVVFKKGPDIFRAEGVFPTPIKIKIPTGSYTIDEAIVLVGRESDYVLLATGVMSGTTPVSSGSDFQISDSTTKITFTVQSLTANIKAGGGSFEIAENTGSPTAIEDNPDFAGKTAVGSYGADPNKNPWFQLPSNTSGIDATLTIAGLSATGSKIVRASGVNAVTASKVTLTAEDLPSIAVSSPNVGDPITNGQITITLATPVNIANSPNRYGIIFNVPVVGYESGIQNQVTWVIRGGTINGFDHTNSGNDSIPLLVYSGAPPVEHEVEVELGGW